MLSIGQAINHLKTRKTLHGIMIITFLLGYAALYLGLSYGEGMLAQVQTMQLKKSGYYAQLSLTEEQRQSGVFAPTRGTIDAFLQSRPGVQGYTCVTHVSTGSALGGDSGRYFHMIDPEFPAFYNYSIVGGRFFIPEEFAAADARVCLAETGVGGVRVGDSIAIGDAEYTVVGLIASALFRSSVLIPQTGRYNGDITGFDVVMRADTALPPPINWDELPFFQPVTQTTDAYSRGLLRYAGTNFGAVLAVCLVLFAYMMFNTYNILKNKATEDAAGFGVRMALGARWRDVFYQFFLEVLLLMLAGLALLLALDPLLAPLIRTTFEHRLGTLTVGVLLGSCVLSAYVLAKTVLRKTKKRAIMQVIREGQL